MMKRCENGNYIEMTPEEVAALQQQEAQPAEQTVEERLAALEMRLAEKEGT